MLNVVPSPGDHLETSTERGRITALFVQQIELMNSQLEVLATHDAAPLEAPAATTFSAPRNEAAAALRAPPSPPEIIELNDGLQDRYLRTFSRRYNQSHARSRAYAEQHRRYLADGRRAAGFRPTIKTMLYPIVGASASGATVQDLDGNDYIDLTMGFGVLLAGHAPEFLESELVSHRASGLDLGPQSAIAGDVARLVVEFTGLPRVTFCNSGTEAVMTSIRLARAATRRTRVVMFSGSYHGHFDGVLALNGGRASIPTSPGTPGAFIQDVMVLEYGSEQTLVTIREQADQLAAILVEPVQSRAPERQPRAFLHSLREICDTSSTALIFDELLTGFRIAPGGAQAWFGVRADIATYGKIVGGGTPIGIIAGEARFLDGIDGGDWGYDNDGFPEAERVFFAGTFNKNCTTMVAARAMLTHLKAEGEQLQQRLNDQTSKLVARLNAVFAARKLALRVVSFGSMFRFVIASDSDIFFYHLIQNGVYVWEGRTCFLSTAHKSDEIDRVVRAVERSLDEMRDGGFFPSAADPAEDGKMPAEAAG